MLQLVPSIFQLKWQMLQRKSAFLRGLSVEFSAYVSRIQLEIPLFLDYETLHELHRAHMLAVPFENLDIIPLQRQIKLTKEAL